MKLKIENSHKNAHFNVIIVRLFKPNNNKLRSI